MRNGVKKTSGDEKCEKKNDAHDRAYYATKITEAWHKQVETIVATGKLLLEAKDNLKHGGFGKLFSSHSRVTPGRKKGEVPISERIGQMLMAIAKHPVLANPKYFSDLPASYTTLYELAGYEEQDLLEWIERGLIHPEITKTEIPIGSRSCNEVSEALQTLQSAMSRTTPKQLAKKIQFRFVRHQTFHGYAGGYFEPVGWNAENLGRLGHLLGQLGAMRAELARLQGVNLVEKKEPEPKEYPGQRQLDQMAERHNRENRRKKNGGMDARPE